jgi:hypothetical protein
MPFRYEHMKVCLMKRSENQIRASVKVIAASIANSSSLSCLEPFLRKIARK